VRHLIAGGAIDSLGSGLSAGCVVIYFVTVVGFSSFSVAAALTAGGLLGVLSPIVVGRLADRWGLVEVYCTVLVVRGLGVLLYALVYQYPAFLLATLVILTFENTTFPLQQSLIAAVVTPERRMRVVSQVRGARNAAMGLGALLAGLVLASGEKWLLIVAIAANGASFFVMAAAVYAVGRRGSGSAAIRHEPRPFPGPSVLKDRRFLTISGINGVVAVHDTILFFLMPLWVVTILHLPPWLPGVLLAVNTGLTVLFQVVVGWFREPPSSGAAMYGAGSCLFLACAIAAFAERDPRWISALLCVVVVVLLTVGENLHILGSWDFAFQVTPERRRSEYLSAFNIGWGIQGVVGPLLASAVLVAGAAGWLALAVLVAAAAVAFQAVARGIQSRAQRQAPPDRTTQPLEAR
jgi:MFS family permease